MKAEVMLTTFDNPYDPFDDFIQWFMFDVEKGYYTCNLLGRIARSSEEFSTVEEEREIERAIDVIIDNDFLNIYKKIVRTVNDNDDEGTDGVDGVDEESDEKRDE